MKGLSKYINEQLSKNGIDKLVQYLKEAPGLDDTHIDDYINALSRKASEHTINDYEFEEFFDKHGLSKLNWGRKNTAKKQFINLFLEDSNIDTLINIIKNDGVLSIDDLSEDGNIFKDYCKGWEEEAKTIASWTNSTSANAGPCELLLKFILKEGISISSGDVGLRTDTIPDEMEVKAATLSKDAAGGHAAGQKGDIRKAWSIYWYLDKNLFKLNTSTTDADKLRYFQNNTGLKDFNQKIKDAEIEDVKVISDNIVNALCYQYRFIEGENNYNSKLKNLDKLYDSAYKLCNEIYNKDTGFKSSNDICNLVGCIQLYLYSQVEQFKYFFVVLIDKNINNESAENGKYWCIKNCKSKNSDLLNFDLVLSKLYFGKLDSPTSTQGRTGKIKVIRSK